MTDETPLKLRAETKEDLVMLSALLQDGLVATQDMRLDKAKTIFVMLINRYVRDHVHEGDYIHAGEGEGVHDHVHERAGDAHRRLCGLKIGYVVGVRQRGLILGRAGFYNLLSIGYREEDKIVTLDFSGEVYVHIQVTQLAMTLGDVAPPHPSFARPDHESNEGL